MFEKRGECIDCVRGSQRSFGDRAMPRRGELRQQVETRANACLYAGGVQALVC
jgi:hypothetical protein